jgi:hypothetical protein
MTLPFISVIETIVLLKEAVTKAMPVVMFLAPLALRTLSAVTSSLRRSAAVAALGASAGAASAAAK